MLFPIGKRLSYVSSLGKDHAIFMYKNNTYCINYFGKKNT